MNKIKDWSKFKQWFSAHFQDGCAIKPVGYWDINNWKAVSPSPEALERFNKRYPNET